jgi:hypothetical protein
MVEKEAQQSSNLANILNDRRYEAEMKLAQRTVKLSASGLTNIPRKKEFDDFTFIVGDCRYYVHFSLPIFCHRRLHIKMTLT